MEFSIFDHVDHDGQPLQKLFETRLQIVAAYDATDRDAAAVAERLTRDFPAGFAGIIPWDEMGVFFGAELGEVLDLGWNPVRVIERCRDKGVMKAWLRRHATPS